jgi:hypothetical protein
MILNSSIFFEGNIIYLSFVCNNGQIDNLLSEVESSLIDRIFEKVGTVEETPQTELVNVLRYFAFIEMMTAITNDFSAKYVKSYFANILSENPTLAFEMTRNKITQARIYAFREVQKFELDGWKIYAENYELCNYL